MKLYKKNNNWHIVRRVPKRYHSIESRRLIWISLSTDSERTAYLKAPGVWDKLLQSWEARLKGDTSDADAKYEAARDIAKSYGFTYLPMERVLQLPTEEVFARMDAVHDKTGKPKLDVARALLGAVPKPTMRVSAALNQYWSLAKDLTVGKSEDQIRRWRNPRIKAVRNFINICGDLDISQIGTEHMLDFREWLVDRVEAGEITPNTANKDLIHLSGILRLVNKRKRLGLALPLSDLALKQGETRTRAAFSTDWIVEKIMAPGALDGLNKEARCILLGMINTGYRPSEACVLGKEQIVLDAEIPYISIEPIGRTLKSQYARRLVPLLGVGLEAFKACPEGFPRYAERANVSSTLTKFLTENGLRETPDTTCYSLRHSFQARMVKHGVDDRIRRDIFGHALTEERYGEIDLETRRDALIPVAL